MSQTIDHQPEEWALLRRIGLTPLLLQQALALGPFTETETLQRVARVERDHLLLHDGQLERPARAMPALLAQGAAEQDGLAVGDWVRARSNALGELWVHARLESANCLARRLHDGRDKVTRAVIVSNVDVALLTMGLDQDFNLRRLQRYVALARMNELQAVVVLTKADLQAGLVQERLNMARSMLPADVPALAVDGRQPTACIQLQSWLGEGRTVVLLGSSGAGKSTLTNTLLGQTLQATGAARQGDGRGRHTTTARSLFVLPAGGCIIDTPGLRTLRLDADEDALAHAHEDVLQWSGQCRFRDCRHEGEPGCAVREHVSDEQLRGWHKLRREVARDTLSLRQRQEQHAQWKARARHARMRMEAKRG